MTASRESTPAIAPVGHPGAIGRLVDVVVDPRAAFRAIAERPSWLAAIVAVVVARMGSLFVFYEPELTPLKLVAGVAFQFAMLTPMVLATATLLWVSSRIWRVRISWSTGFVVVVHVLFAYTVVTLALASAAGALLPASAEVDVRDPPFVNLASLVDEAVHPTWARVLAEADVRSAYALTLAALGLTAADPMATRVRIVGAVASCLVLRVAATVWAPTR